MIKLESVPEERPKEGDIKQVNCVNIDFLQSGFTHLSRVTSSVPLEQRPMWDFFYPPDVPLERGILNIKTTYIFMPHAHQMFRCNERQPPRVGHALDDNF